MGFKTILANLAVSDIEAAKAWYADFFGRQPDRVPMANDAEWDFPGGSTVQVVEAPQDAGHSTVTLEPETALRDEVERLANLGLEPESEQEGTFRIAIFLDPDGNQLVLAEPA
jgi:catechol 2,3-dioxygenase-like lactoylglutathione lyase family enzyme